MKAIWILRGAALLIFCVVAARPVATRPDPGLPSRWAVLIDDSLSMRVKDPEARLGAAAAIGSRLADRVRDVSFFRFSEGSATPLPEEELKSLTPAGKRSDLASALESVFSTKEYRGAVVLTDGRHVGAGDPVSVAAGA